MEVYAGQIVTVRVRGTDPVTRAIITDANSWGSFYNPSLSPITNPGDRANPDSIVTLTFDPVSRFYLGEQDTTGFDPGIWSVQGVVEGGANGYQSWDWYTFTVLA